jgi:hypothetical protein
LDPAFHIKILEPFIPIFIEKSAKAVERLQEQLGKPEFDLYEYTLGVSMDNILGKLQKQISFLSKIQIYSFFQLPQWVPRTKMI